MSAESMASLNKSPQPGTLSTSSKGGKVDSAVFGSPGMTDEKTVAVDQGWEKSI